MKHTLILICVIVLFASTAFGQNYPTDRALHAQGLILDDGNGHTYSLFVPPLQHSSVFTLPVLPDALPTAGYVGQGLTLGQTLSWNGSAWLPSDALINDGTDVTATGMINASGFIGSGLGITSLDAGALVTGIVPRARLAGITGLQLDPNAGIVDGQIASLNAAKLFGILPALDGGLLTNLNPANLGAGTAGINITGNALTATTSLNLSGSVSESQVLGLSNDLFARAFDAQVVHLTNSEVIVGTKTFSNPVHADITGNAATATAASQLTGTIAESQVVGLTSDLAALPSSAALVHTTGDETVAGVKTFSSPIAGSITGSAVTATTATNLSGSITESQVTGLTADLAAVPNSAALVHTTGDETVAGVKTFSSPIAGSITGSAATATTATNLSGSITESQVTGLTADLAALPNSAALVHTTGDETVAGVKTFSSPIAGSITGSAATATTASTLTGSINESQVTNLVSDLDSKALDANVVHLSGSETIAGTKTFSTAINASVTGSAATITGSIPESQVTNLLADLASHPTDGTLVHNTGAESIAGSKTFTSQIIGSISGNAATSTDGLTSASGTGPLTLTLTNKALTGSIATASAGSAGVMSASDKSKLDAITGTNTGDQTITLQGDVTGTGTSTFSTTLTATGVSAGSYPKVTVDAKGRVTAGTTLTSADIPNNAANTSGTAANVTGVVAVANGGTGTSTGSITPTGDYTITQNSVAVITSEAASASANTLYLKQGEVGIGKVPTTALDINGTAAMTGFTMATGASNTYVLTSDANGVGTWQPAPSGSGGGGSLSGGTTDYIPLWSSSSGLTSSLLYQTGGQIGLNKTTLSATLDVNGTGAYSGLLTANGGLTLGGTLSLGGNPMNADTGKSVGSAVLTSFQAGHGYVDITGANLTASSQIFLSYRRPSIGTNYRTYSAAVTTLNASTHTFRVSFATGDFASGDTIYWMIIN